MIMPIMILSKLIMIRVEKLTTITKTLLPANIVNRADCAALYLMTGVG